MLSIFSIPQANEHLCSEGHVQCSASKNNNTSLFDPPEASAYNIFPPAKYMLLARRFINTHGRSWLSDITVPRSSCPISWCVAYRIGDIGPLDTMNVCVYLCPPLSIFRFGKLSTYHIIYLCIMGCQTQNAHVLTDYVFGGWPQPPPLWRICIPSLVHAMWPVIARIGFRVSVTQTWPNRWKMNWRINYGLIWIIKNYEAAEYCWH